jgi:enoyl-CoA hydratase/carnithine racemase
MSTQSTGGESPGPSTISTAVSDSGHVLAIGLARPEKRNAFTRAMFHALAQAYTRLDEDPALRVGALFAHGGHFTGGLDLPDWAGLFAGGDSLAPSGLVDPLALGRRCRKPIVVALQGRCLTIGIELALAADIVIAAEDTRLGQIEIKRGIYPVGGATLRWPARSGWGNAMRWLLTGDELDAREAHRIGLVQEIVPAGQAKARALALAETIARQAPLGVQATLASAREAFTDGETAAAASLLPRLRPIMASDDVQEGLRAFIARRDGVFSGK